MTSSEPAGSLAEALARVQAELPRVGKSETGKVRSEKASYDYKYADLADVSAAILPVLGKHGLSFLSMPTMDDNGRPVLRYKLMHGASGQEECGVWPIMGNKPQEHGSAITYARRYALMAVTGIAPDGEDDDGNAANQTSGYENAWESAKPPRQAKKAAPAKTTGRQQSVPQTAAQTPPEEPDFGSLRQDRINEFGRKLAGDGTAGGLMKAAELFIAIESAGYGDVVWQSDDPDRPGEVDSLRQTWIDRLSEVVDPDGSALPTMDELRLAYRAAHGTAALTMICRDGLTIDAKIKAAVAVNEAIAEQQELAAKDDTDGERVKTSTQGDF